MNATRVYIGTAYGLVIHSELPLPELIPVTEAPDVTIYKRKLDSVMSKAEEQDTCLLESPKAGMFLLQDGQKIVVDPRPNVEDSLIRAVLLGPVMSALLRQRGLFVLHASCVAINGSAVAFLGGSGWGKSTMAELFHARGCSILSDDVMAIQMAGDYPMVLPSYPQVRLLPDAAASLGHTFEELSPLYAQTPKRAHRFSCGFQQTPLPLKHVYVLARGERNEIEALRSQAAFMALVQHSRALTYLTNTDSLSLHFAQCEKLVKSVSMSTLKRRTSLSDLPDLVRLIEEDLIKSP